MTREDCKKIVEYFPIIEAFANGCDIQFAMHNYKGEFVRWWPSRNIKVACLGSYRIVKPRIKLRSKPCWERVVP